MAARGKIGSHGFTSMDQLTTRLAELELENKNLRKQLTSKSGGAKGTGGGASRESGEAPLTEAQKEALLAGLLSRLTTAAASKIDGRLRSMFKKANTKTAFDQTTHLISMRIDLTWADIQTRVVRGGERSSSVKRTRASSKSRTSD